MEMSSALKVAQSVPEDRYARCVDASKRVRWEIERDVFRGRDFDYSRRFLPDALSRVDRLAFLSDAERNLLTRVQGRTYANMIGMVERFIAAKMLDVSRDHSLGSQVALEALVRFTDEEIKHQELFRRMESMIADQMPSGYSFVPLPDAVAEVVLSKSTWAVLALTCHIELFVLAHYRRSIGNESDVCSLWKDVFLFHWREESQHALLDELEWAREDARLDDGQRDLAVDDLIALIGAVDAILQVQSAADADYFAAICGRTLSDGERSYLQDAVLRAYRWQYIVSGVRLPRFANLLSGMISPAQGERIAAALAPIVGHVETD